MNISYMPKYAWTPAQVSQIKDWLRNQLTEEPRNWVAPPDAIIRRVSLWLNGQMHKVVGGHWEISDGMVYVGQLNTNGSISYIGESVRLGVLTSLIQLFGLGSDEQVIEWLGTGIAKSVSSMFDAVRETLVVCANRRVDYLAIKQGNFVVMIDGKWVNGKGEEVGVDDTWTKVEYFENL